MTITNLFILLASVAVFSSAEMLDVCSDSCVQQNCVGKMFILTPAKATFDKARGMCLALGGDVVQEVLSESGKKYHSQIKAITKAAYDSGLGYIYVGLTDTYEESKWRYWSSGKDYDVTTAAFSWGNGDSGSDYNCVITDGEYIYDNYCFSSSRAQYALCEIESALC